MAFVVITTRKRGDHTMKVSCYSEITLWITGAVFIPCVCLPLFEFRWDTAGLIATSDKITNAPLRTRYQITALWERCLNSAVGVHIRELFFPLSYNKMSCWQLYFPLSNSHSLTSLFNYRCLTLFSSQPPSRIRERSLTGFPPTNSGWEACVSGGGRDIYAPQSLTTV